MAPVDRQDSTYRPFKQFGERLAQARIRAGYASQPALARVLGMNNNTICRHEGGRVLPLPKVIKRYCEVLDMEESELMHGVGGFRPPPGSVVDFLLTAEAQKYSDETRDRLLRVNWDAIADGPVDRAGVEVIARLIDRFVQRRGKSPNAESARGSAPLFAFTESAHP